MRSATPELVNTAYSICDVSHDQSLDASKPGQSRQPSTSLSPHPRRGDLLLQDVRNDAGVHEEALWKLQRHHLGLGRSQAPDRLVNFELQMRPH
jgi:hypothetical protein